MTDPVVEPVTVGLASPARCFSSDPVITRSPPIVSPKPCMHHVAEDAIVRSSPRVTSVACLTFPAVLLLVHVPPGQSPAVSVMVWSPVPFRVIAVVPPEQLVQVRLPWSVKVPPFSQGAYDCVLVRTRSPSTVIAAEDPEKS